VIGSVVVLYNPTEDEIKNINSYIPNVDRAVIVDNSAQNNEKIVELLINEARYSIFLNRKTWAYVRH